MCGLLHRLLAKFAVLCTHMDERDEPDEWTSPVEDVVNQHEDKFRLPLSCTRPWSGMPFKRVVRKAIGQHSTDKSTDDSTLVKAT